ncbi:MAG: tRNA lysidine(34) synthetase TilS [Thermomonas sp.]
MDTAFPDGIARPLLVGLSGGLDSTVLLHLLAHSPLRTNGFRAIHVHHGLHSDADAWAAHCEAACAALGVPLSIARVDVVDTGDGPEASARATRHAAFERELRDGEILALAHHRDDQAETFLLRALRGSGVDGLGAMRPWRVFGRGWLWRPLLAQPREALRDYATAHGLRWIEDPSNADERFDRNFLRNRVMPLLRERWPRADAAFARSSALSAEAADALAQIDDASFGALVDGDTLSTEALRVLPADARARLLRRWTQRLDLPPLPADSLRRIQSELLPAADDRVPHYDWRDARIVRWRGRLHAFRRDGEWPVDWQRDWDGSEPLALPDGTSLALEGTPRFDATVQVRTRMGGERIVLPGRTHSHALKHVLQERGTPPWERARLPLLFAADGSLQAAGADILAAPFAEWLATRHARLRRRLA